MQVKKIFVLLMLVLAMSLAWTACAPKQETTSTSPDAEAPADEAQTPADSAETPADDVAAAISVQVEEAWMPHYEAAAARVKDRFPNAEINFIQIGAFEHLETIDSTDVMNQDVADVYAYPLDRFVDLVEKDALAAFDAPAMAGKLGGFPDYSKSIGNALMKEGSYFGFPYNIETLIIFANEKNAADQKIDLSQPVELTALENPKTALLPIFDAWFGVALTNSADIELLGQADGAFFSDFSQPWAELSPEKQQFIEAIYKYWKINFDANSALFDPDAGWGYIDESFRSGNEGVLRLGGPWETNGVKELTNDGADLGIYPINHITVNGHPLKHWQGGWALGINARCEEDAAKMQLAQAMIEEIVNPEFAVDLFKATGKILENVPADVYTNSDLNEIDKKVIAAVIESYKISQNRPLFREWGEVWDTYKNAILSWNSVKPDSAEAAYEQLQASFASLLERQK